MMKKKEERITARIDQDLYLSLQGIADDMGESLSTAIRILLRQAVNEHERKQSFFEESVLPLLPTVRPVRAQPYQVALEGQHNGKRNGA